MEPKGGSQHTCDIMIFDEERDCHVRITWEDALAATLVLDEDKFMTGQRLNAKVYDGKAVPTTLKDWADKAKAWSLFNQGGKDAPAWGSEGLDLDVRISDDTSCTECSSRNVP